MPTIHSPPACDLLHEGSNNYNGVTKTKPPCCWEKCNHWYFFFIIKIWSTSYPYKNSIHNLQIFFRSLTVYSCINDHYYIICEKGEFLLSKWPLTMLIFLIHEDRDWKTLPVSLITVSRTISSKLICVDFLNMQIFNLFFWLEYFLFKNIFFFGMFLKWIVYYIFSDVIAKTFDKPLVDVKEKMRGCLRRLRLMHK